MALNNNASVQRLSKDTFVTRRYVFGPVPSRRLGLSLGVDVIPKKLCNLDCIYCEVGRTDKRAMRRMEYLPAKEIVEEIRDALATNPNLDFITFSGSGEPTLNSALGAIIRDVKKLTTIPIAVITNGTLLYLEEVRQDLMEADVVLPSLDCVTTEMFQKVNRPHPKLELSSIVQGLKKFREEFRGQIWLEILLVKGYNDSDEEIAQLKEVLDEIQPDKIQLNTVVRPSSESWVQPVDEERMREIQQMLGDRAEIIGTFSAVVQESKQTIDVGTILALLRRRAMTADDLADALRVSKQQILNVLEVLEQNALVVPYRFQNKIYYRTIEYFFSGFCG
ncbi:MAG TPA: radical SAM protein [Bacteroidota bacterium]|nr:radical SAM protein [Bacteroidota bacterium]